MAGEPVLKLFPAASGLVLLERPVLGSLSDIRRQLKTSLLEGDMVESPRRRETSPSSPQGRFAPSCRPVSFSLDSHEVLGRLHGWSLGPSECRSLSPWEGLDPLSGSF